MIIRCPLIGYACTKPQNNVIQVSTPQKNAMYKQPDTFVSIHFNEAQ